MHQAGSPPPLEQLPPPQVSPSPGSSAPASIQISPDGLQLPPMTPDQVPPSPSHNIIRLKSDMVALSDVLANIAAEDLSFPPEFSNPQEAKSYLLKMLQGSLQACNSLRSIINKQDSRHDITTRSLEDKIRLLVLENVQLKQELAAKHLEQKMCLLEIENNQLQGRLTCQDQDLEAGRLQGRAIKDLEGKICQLEVEIGQMQGKLAEKEQAITTMNSRTQLADHVLQVTLQQDLPPPGDTQTANPIMNTNVGYTTQLDKATYVWG
ncbi:hypothetical protein EDB19DRAFT_1907350 [Suillus lakei]|nr:hypothetical protein EDB19DRAFT_1907350 [Suillus lakei]